MDENDDDSCFPLPADALLFETKNDSVFRKGTHVQLVGFGFSLKEDGPPSEGVFIWAQPVHLEDMDGGPDHEYWPESWRYFKEDLRPLTPAAARVMTLRERLDRACACAERRGT